MPTAEAPAQNNLGTSGSESTWLEWITLFLLLTAGTVLRLKFLTAKPFWYDECFSVEMARIHWLSFVRLMWWREANMALYYVLLRVWLHVGQSAFAIRCFSALISAATLPAIYWLARMLYDRRVALIASALFTINCYSVRYAQEARSYSLFLLLATLSSGFLIRWLQVRTTSGLRWYVVTSTLAVYAHIYALLLLFVHWIAIARVGATSAFPDLAAEQNERRAELRRAWKTIAIAVAPLLLFVVKTGAGPIKWIPRPGLRDLLGFFESLSGGSRWPLGTICTVACVFAVVPIGKRFSARDQDWPVWRVQFLLVWLLFPVALTVVLSIARPVFFARYLIFCMPALLTLTAAGLASLRPQWLVAPALGLMLLFGLQGTFFAYTHDFDDERDAAGDATNFILDGAQPGDGVIFHIPQIRLPYEFFRYQRALASPAGAAEADGLGPEILYPRHGPALEYLDLRSKLNADQLRTLAFGHQRVWVVLMYNGPKLPDPIEVLISHVLPESFTSVQRWQFPKVEVRLYSK